MRTTMALVGLCLAVSASSAVAEEPYDGIWGDANQSCRAEDSRLGIKGNRFDWYETHCNAQRLSASGRTWKFALSCSGEGKRWRSVTSLALPSPDRLVMENAPVGPDTRRQVYKRCSGL